MDIAKFGHPKMVFKGFSFVRLGLCPWDLGSFRGTPIGVYVSSYEGYIGATLGNPKP